MIGLTPTSGFAYNNKVHAATCQTLFELNAGQHLHLGVEPMRTSTIEAVDAFARRLDRTQEEAKAALEQAVDDMKQYYDWSHQSALEYKVGDKVWLSLQNYSSDCPMKKLDHKWAGPFTITKVISLATIKLCLSAWEKNIHPIISVSIICPYIPDDIAECPQPPQPVPITVDDQEEYKVQEIRDSRFRCAKFWSRVRLLACSHCHSLSLPRAPSHPPSSVTE